MTIKKYDKLVRDKIPEIIESQGKQCKVYVAVNDDYQQRLKDKLQEEVQEFLEDPCVEELADIEEVLLSIAEVNKWDLSGARIAKNFTRGGFWRRFVLQEVSDAVVENESVTKSKWCSHTPSNTLYIEEE